MARNRLLATAGGIGVLAAVVFLAAKTVAFASVIGLPDPGPGYAQAGVNGGLSWGYVHVPTQTLMNIIAGAGYDDGTSINMYFKVDALLNLAGAVFMVIAFGVAAMAFRRASEVSRRRLLGTAAGAFALYGAMALAAAFIGATVLIGSDWTLPSSFAAAIGSAVALVIAAAMIRAAVRSGVPSRRVARGLGPVVLSPMPSRLLVWGCGWLAAYFGLRAASAAFSSPGSGGVVTEAAGYAVAAVGAAIAAYAFSGETARRDETLGRAATVIGFGFLITAVGLFLQAPSLDASSWVEAVSFLVLAVAAQRGAAAFLEKRHGSDLTVLPNPG